MKTRALMQTSILRTDRQQKIYADIREAYVGLEQSPRGAVA